jgi:murein DD-endopeptidase MepM/ murein hydrolase activator NlpD
MFFFNLSFTYQDIPEGNYRPPYLYPADPKDRLYKLPWAAGKTVTTSDGYGSEPGGSHHPDYAVDWGLPALEPLLAVRAGRVLGLNMADSACNIPGTMGNRVLVSRLDSMRDTTKPSGWRYCRTEDYYNHVYHDIPVKIGDDVKQGQVVAYTSCTGQDGGGPHIHFEVWLHDFPEHQGEFADIRPGYTFISIPTPFVEITQVSNGLPEQGLSVTSQNVPYSAIDKKGQDKKNKPENSLQASPNPFRSNVNIRTTVVNSQDAALDIYNVRGKKVMSLFYGRLKKGGAYNFEWKPEKLPAGLYIARLNLSGRVLVKPLFLVR